MFWMSLDQLADIFGVDKSGISRHLKNIFESGELQKDSVVAKFATTAADGKTYQVSFYNLDAAISVGYRVNSTEATRFRIWATQGYFQIGTNWPTSLAWISLALADILKTSLNLVSYRKIQLLRNLQQLPQMAKPIR